MCSAANEKMPCAGFTLVEVVTVLVIIGMMTAFAGSALVYGVGIYRATQGAAEVLPQAATAVNVMRRIVDRDGVGALQRRVERNAETGTLTLDGEPLLEHVSAYEVEPNVQVFNGLGEVVRISLTIEAGVVGGKARTLTFTVAK